MGKPKAKKKIPCLGRTQEKNPKRRKSTLNRVSRNMAGVQVIFLLSIV